MSKRTDDYRLRRLDAFRLDLPNQHNIPVRLFAGDGVPIERAAVSELMSLLELETTIQRLHAAAPHLFDHANPGIERIALSSDFHKGKGIPVGTSLLTRGVAVPSAVGSDVNCGMRCTLTTWTLDQVQPHLDRLERRLRAIFFGGERNIALTGLQREALLAEGIPGLLYSDALTGSEWTEAADELESVSQAGGFKTVVPEAFRDYIGDAHTRTYDSQIGSIGGGNHFAEVQVVAKIHDRATAHAWGIREGQIVLMVHTGSLGFGHAASAISTAVLRSLLPAGFVLPENGILPLPIGEAAAQEAALVRSAHRAAANFAHANRFYLDRMLRRGLAEVAGAEASATVLWDSPHNLLWERPDLQVLHRKGSTPARGADRMYNTRYSWGEPVIVPGSMGAPSFVLLGQGNKEALESACHGAGRALSRGDAARIADADLDAFLSEFRVVTPVDPRQLAGRADMMSAWRSALKEEAPGAYKRIGQVIETLAGAGVAQPVVELHPLLSVKG